MRHLNVVYEKSKRIDLVPLCCSHYCSKDCNFKLFLNYVDWIKRNKNARCILMGDLLNIGIRDSIGAGPYDDDSVPQQQYEEMVEYLRPIKDKIYGMHIGNHEQRIYNNTSINLIKMMCRELDVPYLGYSAFHKIAVGKQNYTIYSTHGCSGATLPHTKIKRCIDLSSSFDADIFLYGHVHSLQNVITEYRYIDMRKRTIEIKKKFFILTGHFLDYEGGYAEAKNYVPARQGAPKIKLYADKFDVHLSV